VVRQASESIMRETQKPKLVKGDGRLADTIETHPCYATIGVSRVSGRQILFGSDFEHQHYMIVRIRSAELVRGVSNDHVHSNREYIEVALSESQWATFVSSPNMSGVPCTLIRKDGKLIPELPELPDRRSQFTKELKDRLELSKQSMSELVDQIKDLKVSDKQKKALLSTLHTAQMNLIGNVEFVEEQFREHVERNIEAAKQEINAYMASALQRAGLDALTSADSLIRMLDDGQAKP
jgi:cysteinyl-tRNA synthetase